MSVVDGTFHAVIVEGNEASVSNYRLERNKPEESKWNGGKLVGLNPDTGKQVFETNVCNLRWHCFYCHSR